MRQRCNGPIVRRVRWARSTPICRWADRCLAHSCTTRRFTTWRISWAAGATTCRHSSIPMPPDSRPREWRPIPCVGSCRCCRRQTFPPRTPRCPAVESVIRDHSLARSTSRHRRPPVARRSTSHSMAAGIVPIRQRDSTRRSPPPAASALATTVVYRDVRVRTSHCAASAFSPKRRLA